MATSDEAGAGVHDRLKESGGTDMVMGAIAEGELFSRSGSSIVGTTAPAAGTLDCFHLSADDFLNPNNASWAVNALAPAVADTNDPNKTVRLFDQTTEEGVGFKRIIPTGAVNIVIRPKGRSETTQAGVRTVGLKLYAQQTPNNGAVTAWFNVVLADLSMPANELFQYDSETIALSAFSTGLIAGDLTQFELTRIAPTGGTNLAVDWAMEFLTVEFT